MAIMKHAKETSFGEGWSGSSEALERKGAGLGESVLDYH